MGKVVAGPRVSGSDESAMVDDPTKLLKDLVKQVGPYSDEAFLFVREGLSRAAEKCHGPESEAHRNLYRYLAAKELDWDELIGQYHRNELPSSVVENIEAAGGCENLNRHVSGRELCWGLRDFAIQRWGLMARVVLESWKVKTTKDFGRIVFGFIDFNIMQKQPGDRLDDFENVYSFREAFDEVFQVNGYDGNHNDGDN